MIAPTPCRGRAITRCIGVRHTSRASCFLKGPSTPPNERWLSTGDGCTTAAAISTGWWETPCTGSWRNRSELNIQEEVLSRNVQPEEGYRSAGAGGPTARRSSEQGSLGAGRVGRGQRLQSELGGEERDATAVYLHPPRWLHAARG